MSRRLLSRAGALGGLAAGVAALCAQSALADEPAATGVLRALGADGRPAANFHPIAVSQGGLRPVGVSVASLKPLPEAPVVRISYGLPALAGGDPLTCLAQAVYFEARSESEAGQRAVAQVVMNRTRLPQFAPSVCGVVFQGAERATGCQFTFACDGSLRAPDDPAAWDRALAVARDALGGLVYQPMLAATHYHAAWMRPWWAGELSRIGRIGGQVFYH